MNSRRSYSIVFSNVFTFSFCTVILAISLLCQPTHSWAAENPALPGVDLKDLDADEVGLMMTILKEQFDPCGKPRSFVEALQDQGTCDKAIPLANYVVKQVQAGLSKRQIIRALLKEIKRMSARYSFTVKGRPFIGPDNAKVTVVQFSDYQCPHCRMASKTLKKLIKDRSVRVVFKQYPLSFHKAARPAAIASVQAHFQGKFWKLHEMLYEDQEKLTEKWIGKLAKKSGLNMKRFKEDHGRAVKMVDDDRTEGELANIEGTPTYFVNGRLVEYEELDERISAELKK